MNVFNTLLICICIWKVTCKIPNILFLNVDQMDGRNMDPTSPDQYNSIQMPNLRNMASKGTQFIRHYTNGPQCVCGRSVLWTGRRTNDINVYHNGFGIASATDGSLDSYCTHNYHANFCSEMSAIQSVNFTILTAMQSLGYNVYIYGKLHIGAGIMDMQSQSNATMPAFVPPTQETSFGSITRSANILNKWTNESNSAGPINWVNDTTPDPHSSDENIAQKCVERLNDLGSNPQSKPFMLYCSINIPHPPYHTNSTWLEHVNINNIQIPSWNKTNYNSLDKYTSLFENLWNENYTNSQIIHFRKTYFGLNSQADYLLGKVMNSLYLNGFNLSNTYIVFTSDHGEMNLDHRQAGKNSMYEGASRIPLFIAGPNITSNTIIKNVTETVDVLPTLMSLGQSDNIPNWLAGSTLMPFLNGKVTNNHANYITSQYHSLKASTGLFMVRKDEYKYIQYGHYLSAFANYKPQLFDLNNDPSELNDISDSHKDIVNEMEQLLLNRYNYEYVDCIAKKTDLKIFNQFIWNIYNQTQVYKMFAQTYHGFNQTDWQNVIKWRDELSNAPNCIN